MTVKAILSFQPGKNHEKRKEDKNYQAKTAALAFFQFSGWHYSLPSCAFFFFSIKIGLELSMQNFIRINNNKFLILLTQRY